MFRTLNCCASPHKFIMPVLKQLIMSKQILASIKGILRHIDGEKRKLRIKLLRLIHSKGIWDLIIPSIASPLVKCYFFFVFFFFSPVVETQHNDIIVSGSVFIAKRGALAVSPSPTGWAGGGFEPHGGVAMRARPSSRLINHSLETRFLPAAALSVCLGDNTRSATLTTAKNKAGKAVFLEQYWEFWNSFCECGGSGFLEGRKCVPSMIVWIERWATNLPGNAKQNTDKS